MFAIFFFGSAYESQLKTFGPGRFDRILEIPVPSKEARKQILEIHLNRKPIDSTVNIEKLVELTVYSYN
jgi:ATP-dependent 26S proteasome regulatory subunit